MKFEITIRGKKEVYWVYPFLAIYTVSAIFISIISSKDSLNLVWFLLCYFVIYSLFSIKIVRLKKRRNQNEN